MLVYSRKQHTIVRISPNLKINENLKTSNLALAAVRKLTFLIFTAFLFPPHRVFALDFSLSSWVFYYYYYFNWRIIALQCCISFYHITSWISHNRVCVCVYISIYLSIYLPSLLSLFPISHSSSRPSRSSQSIQAELPVLCSRFPLAVYFTRDSVYMPMLLSHFVPPSPSPTVFTSLFSVCVSIPSLQLVSSVKIFLDSVYIL